MARCLPMFVACALNWAMLPLVVARQDLDPVIPQGDELVADVLGPATAKLAPAELASVAADVKPGVLTLEQAYSLAMIRARKPGVAIKVGPGNHLDSRLLEEQARDTGAGDFERFRGEFLSSDFRDPAPRFLAALKHRYAVDSARDRVALAARMRRLCDKLLQSQASPVSQLMIGQVDQYLVLARQNLAIELASYRSAVDELKVSVGLPVSSPIVLEEGILEPFRKSFAAIDRWQRSASRQLNELTTLHDRLPGLEDFKIGGHSLAEMAQGKLAEETFLQTCVDVARKALKDDHATIDDRNAWELHVREMVRRLILLHTNSESARKGLELSAREADQWLEQLLAPPLGSNLQLNRSMNVSAQIPRVLEAQIQLYRGRERLVSQRLEFKESSLALYRDLGFLPYANWEEFYRSFQPGAGGSDSRADLPRP